MDASNISTEKNSPANEQVLNDREARLRDFYALSRDISPRQQEMLSVDVGGRIHLTHALSLSLSIEPDNKQEVPVGALFPPKWLAILNSNLRHDSVNLLWYLSKDQERALFDTSPGRLILDDRLTGQLQIVQLPETIIFNFPEVGSMSAKHPTYPHSKIGKMHEWSNPVNLSKFLERAHNISQAEAAKEILLQSSQYSSDPEDELKTDRSWQMPK